MPDLSAISERMDRTEEAINRLMQRVQELDRLRRQLELDEELADMPIAQPPCETKKPNRDVIQTQWKFPGLDGQDAVSAKKTAKRTDDDSFFIGQPEPIATQHMRDFRIHRRPSSLAMRDTTTPGWFDNLVRAYEDCLD